MPSTPAQRRASLKYANAHKGEKKKFSTEFPKAEAEHIESVLTEKGLTKADFIRRGIARLERGEDL